MEIVRIHRGFQTRTDKVPVAYRGGDVTLDHIIGVLTSRESVLFSILDKLPLSIPLQKRLLTNSISSRVLLFLNGHGGENFLRIRV